MKGVNHVFITNEARQYRVGEKVAVTASFRAYLCEEVESGRRCLLQIASDVSCNGDLERAAFVLRQLRRVADEFEELNAQKFPDGRPLSYERLFPEVVDSFVPDNQGARRVNILAFAEVEDVTLLVPMSNLLDRDHQRISLTSSAWVLGRLLKLLAFAHDEGVAVRALGGSNILLEPDRHFALVFDWSSAQLHDSIPSRVRRSEIASAASAVFRSIGGNVETGEYPYQDIVPSEIRYIEYVWQLATRPPSNALKVHHQFYELVDELWGRSFRPFTTMPL